VVINIIVKNLLTLALIALGAICYAQAPQVPSTITVKGDFSGIVTNTLGNGETETIIACVCSENACYTISRTTVDVGTDGGGHLDSDCGGTGVDLIPKGTKIQLTIDGGVLLYEGVLLSYSNYPNGSDPFNRNNRFVFQQ
tara:strand:- start:2177 stop:2596 length:420 start_codon:yes stop_codon:yes gene_type:complete